MNILKTNNRFSSLLEDNKPVHTRQVNESRYINKYKMDIKSSKINTNTNIENKMVNTPLFIGKFILSLEKKLVFKIFMDFIWL